MTGLQGTIRIIGGRWRSRRITFPAIPGLRPTHDRVRETLFNWLVPYIEGAVCLDVFAGSGALGFEALSRGAKHVTFVDHSKSVLEALKKNADVLETKDVEFVLGECPHRVSPLGHAPFDIVFLDPPFFQGLVKAASEWLEQEKILSKRALIYVEAERTLTPLPVPSSWQLLREKKTSSLSYYLFQREIKYPDSQPPRHSVR